MSQKEKRNTRERARQLAALNQAALTIAGDLDLDRVLRKILRTAQRLVTARYGALGVPDGRGGFGRFLTVGISEQRASRIGSLPRVHGVLGALVTEGKPIRVRDIRRHPRFSWYPDHHPVMQDFLGVPIRHGREVVGNLFFSGSRRGAFTAEDQQLVEMLAAHAGIAINTARLYAKAQELAVMEERNRMARELHDAVSQSLFSMMYQARAAALNMEHDSGRAREALHQLEIQTAAALEEMRSLVFALRPKSLERDGLASALHDHVDTLRRIHSAPIDIRVEGERRLAPEQELALLRIAQEALRNALQHAAAPVISVHLRYDRTATQLVVRDGGRGFDLDGLPRTRRTLGLQSMRERASAVGATLTIEAGPQQGCTIRVILPNGARPAR